MSVLDHDRIARDDPTTIALHEILIRAYDDDVEALSLAGQVEILRADIERFATPGGASSKWRRPRAS